MSETRKFSHASYDTEPAPKVDPRQTVIGGPRLPHVKMMNAQQTPPPTIPNMPTLTPERAARHRNRHRQNLMGGCMAIGGAVLAFGCVAGIIMAILLPGFYRSQRPEVQEIWCIRAERVYADFVCDWKPTAPYEFIPSDFLQSGTDDPDFDPMSILTPRAVTGTPSDTGLNITPFAASLPLPTHTGEAQAAIALEPTALPTSTLPPTAIPTATPSITPLPTATAIPLPVSHKLDLTRLTYQAQTWNNCGPATLSMGLSYFGYRNHQSIAARYLKPNPEDKNVSPYQMVSYVNQEASAETSVNALTRVGGDMQLLKRLLVNNFPVIVEKGYDVENLDWMGHYLLVVGYDDVTQIFYTYDSYLGHGNSQGLPETYSHLEENWRHFNNTFIVLYPPERQNELLNLLGATADPISAAQTALERARQAIADNPEDGWGWFNLGHSYTLLGDYEQAAQAFDEAFSLNMPWRILWYLHQPYVAYFAMGRYNDIISLANNVQAGTVYVEETFYYRGAALALQGDIEGAKAQFDQALRYNSNFQAARIARDALANGQFSASLITSAIGPLGIGG